MNYQILEAINSAIADQVLPSIHNTPGTQAGGIKSKVDIRITALHRNCELEKSTETREYWPKKISNLSN